MAVDEVLLQRAAEGGGCCWRFYRWSEPTLSLGYFQLYEDRHGHSPSCGCDLVRRASGGGAILHDAELTYSFVVPNGHPLARKRSVLYQSVHRALIDALGDLGLAARLYGRATHKVADPQPFLCFRRRSEGDVVVGDIKIAGSAQRRNQGAVLQHGSVLLGQSSAAPELEGLNRLLNNNLDDKQLIELWLPRLGSRLELQWYEQPLTWQERSQAAHLAEAKYGSENWSLRRGRSNLPELL